MPSCCYIITNCPVALTTAFLANTVIAVTMLLQLRAMLGNGDRIASLCWYNFLKLVIVSRTIVCLRFITKYCTTTMHRAFALFCNKIFRLERGCFINIIIIFGQTRRACWSRHLLCIFHERLSASSRDCTELVLSVVGSVWVVQADWHWSHIVARRRQGAINRSGEDLVAVCVYFLQNRRMLEAVREEKSASDQDSTAVSIVVKPPPVQLPPQKVRNNVAGLKRTKVKRMPNSISASLYNREGNIIEKSKYSPFHVSSLIHTETFDSHYWTCCVPERYYVTQCVCFAA